MVIRQAQEDILSQFGGMSCDELVPSHPFEDEITRTLRFTGAGILAMV